MKKKHLTTNSDQTQEFAKELVEKDLHSNVLLLEGDLGAGKTTFAQGALKALGAEGPFTSPTFVIMKVYRLSSANSKGQSAKLKFENVYHIDAYRVGDRDVLDLGWEEIISNPKNLVLVEWPDRIKGIWPKQFVKISFDIFEKSKRTISIVNKK